MYKRLLSLCLVCCGIVAVFTACSDYEETVNTYELTITLQFPDATETQKDGIRVELKSIGHDALFVDSTNTEGKAHFQITSGIYEASSSATRPQTPCGTACMM